MTSTKPMRPRELQALALLTTNGPMQRAELARLLGCAPATAGQHLWMLKVAGKAHSQGWGCMAVWHPGPKPMERLELLPVRQALHELHQVWR